MDPKLLKNPELDEANNLLLRTSSMLTAMGISRSQQSFDKACREEAAAIRKIADSGDLAVMLALEYQLQLHDLTNYAKTDRGVKNTRLGLTDFIAALTNYERLTTRPEEYRRQAAGFPSGGRDKKFDVPMDGMRQVINSQMTRIQQRQSLMVSDSEKELHTARWRLLDSIRGEYALLQQRVVHG